MGRIRASLENDIFPALGSRPMAALKASEVMEAVKQVEARGAADQAGRVLQRVKAIYRWAVTHQRIDTNPMLDLVPSEILKPRTVQHRAALAEKELPEFMRKLAAYDGAPKHCAGPAHAHAHGLQARGSARRALGGIRPQGGPVDHPRRAHEDEGRTPRAPVQTGARSAGQDRDHQRRPRAGVLQSRLSQQATEREHVQLSAGAHGLQEHRHGTWIPGLVLDRGQRTRMEPGCDRAAACAQGAERDKSGVSPGHVHGGPHQADAMVGGLSGENRDE